MDGLDNRLACRQAAQRAAQVIRRQFGMLENTTIPLAVILGTGWGDALKLENPWKTKFRSIPGFETLEDLEGHAREILLAEISGVPTIILRGRIHLYESFLPKDRVALMVRLMIEMLIELGVILVIATAAVGDLEPGTKVPETGRVIAVKGFSTLYAGRLPLFGGEFVCADTVLDPELRRMASDAAPPDMEFLEAGHVMIRGPHFASIKYDYPRLHATEARVVGMSLLPEASIIAARNLPENDVKPSNVKLLALANVTDTPDDHLSHELVQERAKKLSPKLGELLENIVRNISIREADL